MLPLPISAFGWRTPPTWVARTSGPAGRAPHQHGDPFRVSGHRCDLPWMSPLGRMLGPRRQLGTALRAACRPNRSEPSRVPASVGSPILRIRRRPPKRGGRLPHSPTGCQARPWGRAQGLGGPATGPGPAACGPTGPQAAGPTAPPGWGCLAILPIHKRPFATLRGRRVSTVSLRDLWKPYAAPCYAGRRRLRLLLRLRYQQRPSWPLLAA